MSTFTGAERLADPVRPGARRVHRRPYWFFRSHTKSDPQTFVLQRYLTPLQEQQIWKARLSIQHLWRTQVRLDRFCAWPASILLAASAGVMHVGFGQHNGPLCQAGAMMMLVGGAVSALWAFASLTVQNRLRTHWRVVDRLPR